jgi:hypothetical protein
MGLLISAPGTRFPRGGPGASSAPLAPAGSPVTSQSRRSRVPSAPIIREENNLNHCNILFPALQIVLQSFIFWQVAEITVSYRSRQ